MSKFKTPSSKNSRKRLTENASTSRIAEADNIWHSTAIDDLPEEDFNENVAPPLETPIRGKQAKVMSTGPIANKRVNEIIDRDCGREQSSKRAASEDMEIGPVVINPSSGHSFFSSVLQKCGYIIRQPVSNNEMYKDAMKFRKVLSDWLVENEDEMKRIETETSKFLKALDSYLSEKQNFIAAMKPTRHETELIQPSLLHCVLGIDALQPQALKVVFLNLIEASISSSEENVSLVSTILNQLKWLPNVVNGEKFAESLLSIISNASLPCQSLIVKFLPDILPSTLHTQVAEKLLEKFSDEGALNIALMDCFSSLDIPDGSWSSIRTAAIDQMATAHLKDIPAYFSFLFRGQTSEEVSEVVTAIREKVQLVPETRSSKSDAHQVEILEKVGFCITVNPTIVNVWTKLVKYDLQNEMPDEIKKIDLLMMFIFAESHDSKALPALKMLFAEKQHVLNLFDELMKQNTPMVYQLFTTISRFLDKLLRSRDAKCLETVCEITVKLFLGLGAIEAQTLMGNMTGILINFPPSRDTVLQILTKLAEKEPKKLLLFAPYLMGVLEYVMQFPAGQIRSLMNVLAILSQTEGRIPGESNHFSAEFSILLRKQLTHSDLKIRCFGVYGALASIRRMSQQEIPNDVQIRELLKLAWTFVERDEDACSIFLDELSSCVRSLPNDVCRTYRDILANKFQTLWTVDEVEEHKIAQFRERCGLQLVPVFDANKECTDDRFLINFENHPLNMSPLVVPAHMRVLALLESQVESDLVGIDAILGSPVLFPSLQEYYERESIIDLKYNQRHNLGQYLVLAINFFRESISAFVKNDNSELRVKVWHRLENILKLQKFLVKHFDSFPTLPHAYVAEKTIGSSKDGGAGPSGLQAFRMAKEGKPASKAEKPKSTAPKKPKSTKKKARTEVFSASEDEEAEAPAAGPVAAIQKKTKVSLDEEIQPKRIFPFLRRIDENVFALLRCKLRGDNEEVSIGRILLDLSSVSQNTEIVNKVETFTPETLALLLTELKRQVQDPRSNLDILKVKKLLRYVCELMQQIQTILLRNEENDMAEITENQGNLECCLRLLIDILIAYFEAIKKLDRDEKEKYIQRTIRILKTQAVNQNTDEDGGTSSQTEVMAVVASYLGCFESVIKDSSTALDHMKLLKNLHDLLGDHSEFKKAIDSAAKVYLRNDWKLPSAKVDGFLKIWMSTVKSPVKVINHLADKILSSEEDNNEEEDGGQGGRIFNSNVYKSCSATNFHTWYTAMLQGLSQYVYKNLRKRGDFDDSINDWVDAVGIFKRLVSIAQAEFKPKHLKNFILTALLKHCRMFLEAFISGGAELLPQYMRQNNDAAQTFCKSLQVPCRIIQHICEHSKIHTDLQLLKSVPLVKRVLETLVFRVREVLGAAGAANAFWMGALKHRDLKGVMISSQIADGSGSWSTDEEIGSDEEDGEEIQAAPLSGMTEEPDIFNENSMDVGSDDD